MTDTTGDCWRDFALAIVRQAVEDYRLEYRRALRGEDRSRQLSSLERFFAGDWCRTLCGTTIEPRVIVRAVRESEEGAFASGADD